MNELLEQILATDVLTEETKAQISTAFQQLLAEQVEAAKAEAEADVRTQLTEQWITERDALIDALDEQVTSLVEAEMTELKGDIENFRDLEVEYAGKLVEAKEELASQLDSDIHALAEEIDQFITLKLTSELSELKESIQEVKKNELGRKAFEMFAREYQHSFIDKTELEKSVMEAQEQVKAANEKLAESEARFQAIAREQKLAELLAPLSGKNRTVMESILKPVETSKLDEAYNMFLGRVLKESKQPAQEKDKTVLAESADVKTTDTVVKTGDAPQDKTIVTESVAPVINPELEKLRRLAGI